MFYSIKQTINFQAVFTLKITIKHICRQLTLLVACRFTAPITALGVNNCLATASL